MTQKVEILYMKEALIDPSKLDFNRATVNQEKQFLFGMTRKVGQTTYEYDVVVAVDINELNHSLF